MGLARNTLICLALVSRYKHMHECTLCAFYTDLNPLSKKISSPVYGVWLPDEPPLVSFRSSMKRLGMRVWLQYIAP